MHQVQTRLFEFLIKKFGRPKVVFALKNLLFLEKSAVYKRLSGEKELSLAEAVALAGHFEFSLDRLLGSGRTMVFKFPKEKPTALHSPLAFLESVAHDFTKLAAGPPAAIKYLAGELPIFYYFHQRELTLFKLFQWNRIAWRQPWLLHEKFNPDPHRFGGERVFELADQILKAWEHLPSTEILSSAILDNTLQQLLFSAKVGQFESAEMPRLLFTQIRAMLDLLEKRVEKGEKGPANRAFEVFHNPTAHSTTMILIAIENRPAAVYTVLDNPNFIKSTDEEFGEYAFEMFERLTSVSVNIAHSSEISRAEFFTVLRERVDRAEARVMAG